MSAIVPLNSVARCGHPGELPAPVLRARSPRRSTPSQRTAPASGSSRRSSSAASVLLPSPLAPTSATSSPGSMRRCSAVEHGLAAARVGDAHVLQLDRAGAHVGRRERARGGAHGRRGVEHGEQAPGGLQAVGARVEVLADHADGQVQLGREQQHGQPDGERDVPVDRAAPRRSRRRAPSRASRAARARARRGRRSAASPSSGAGRRRRPSVSVCTCARVAVVGAQRLEPADDVEEVRAEERERLPALLRGALRREPDEDHEQRDQRDRDEQDQARPRGRAGTT